MNSPAYPMIEVPERFAKPNADYTKHDSDAYFDWFMGLVPKRIATLFSVLDIQSQTHDEQAVTSAVHFAAALLQTPAFYRPANPEIVQYTQGEIKYELTGEGLSLAIDVSILVAESARLRHPDFYIWLSCWRRAKLAPHRGKTALVRCDRKERNPYEPFQLGEAIGSSVIHGRESATDWLRHVRTLESHDL